MRKQFSLSKVHWCHFQQSFLTFDKISQFHYSKLHLLDPFVLDVEQCCGVVNCTDQQDNVTGRIGQGPKIVCS